MTENRLIGPSVGVQMAERCTSPPNSGVRKSSRLPKPSLLYSHQDSVPSTSNALPSPVADIAPVASSSVVSKSKIAVRSRNRNKWDPATENLFFDALKLYGKDYDAILKYITQKSKSKSSAEKKYEQVRNYYHNTAAKLLTLLDLSEIDASKEVKELFALINYGEWKRKTNNSKPNGKQLQFFSNLVLRGWTTVRLRASNIKTVGRKKRSACIIRTPMCPALRKYLESKDDIPSDTNVPKNITIELSPCVQRDRAYVLGCWQNPFIRFELNLNQSVNDWLRWLQHKWIPQDSRMKRNVLGEDISNELADIVLYPSADTTLRIVKLNPAGTKPASTTTSSNSGLNTSPFVNLGLRQCFGPKSASSLDARSEHWTPPSPVKNERKRRRSTPAPVDGEPLLSPTDLASMNKAKRFRQELLSPTPDDAGVFGVDAARHSSDGGDGESSCDVYPAIAAAIVEDDSDCLDVDQKLPSHTDAAVGVEESGQSERQDMAARDIISRQQQIPRLVVLDPDILRNGLTLANCESLTIGQICLMCDKARVIRLKYSIIPKIDNSLISAIDSWAFFVSLARSNVVDAIGKKPTATSGVRVMSPPETLPTRIQKGPNEAAVDDVRVADDVKSDASEVAVILNNTADDQRWQQQEASAVITDVFAAPHAVRPSRKRLTTKEPPIAPKPEPLTRASAFVAHECNAFLQQMGQIIKKPVVINRRRAVVVAPPDQKLPAPHRPVVNSSRNQYQRPHSDQASLRIIPPSIGTTAATADAKRTNIIGQDITAEYPVHAVMVVGGHTFMEQSQQGSLTISSCVQVQPAVPMAEQTSTLNTPEVSMLRMSPEPIRNTTMVQHSETVSGPVQEPCKSASGPAENVAAPQLVVQTRNQPELITSDSFLDFSLGSFPGFGAKSGASPRRGLDKEPVSGIIHALRLEPDDSALSSPPRPIRLGVNSAARNSSQNLFCQPGGSQSSNLFPSTSNIFLDAAADNESSTTRNFFAACALATNLDTPEKCKENDRC